MESKGKKGFQPGNQWAKLKTGVKSLKNKEWENMGAKITGEATTAYLDTMEKLFAGEKVSEGELEAMTRYEKILNYFKPRLASSEQKVTVEDKRVILD
jgi:hypothetical protein